MQGSVIAVNPRKGFFAVLMDNGITVIELLGGYDVERDDVISGPLETHGSNTVRNVTQGKDMRVFIQGVWCTPQNAKQLME